MTAYPRLSTMPQEKKRSPFRGLSPCAHSRLAALGPALGAAARGRRAVAGYGLWTTEITVPHQSSYTTPGDASVAPRIPALRSIVPLLDDRLLITDAGIAHLREGDSVRLRMNLSRPVLIGNQLVYPFGSHGVPAGGFQVTDTVGGILQYAELLLIVVLVWPLRTWRELVMRLLLALPLMVLLVVSDAALTAVAEVRNGLDTAFNADDKSGWLTWSRFLMGGGGLAVALAMGAGCIAAARWPQSKPRTPGRKAWREVSRGEFEELYRAYPRPLEVHPPFEYTARRYLLKDISLGHGPESIVAEWRRGRRHSVYRIRNDLSSSD